MTFGSISKSPPAAIIFPFSLNGKPINDFTDVKNTHQSGAIGLQAVHTDTRVDFRNIQLKPLDDGEKVELDQASTHFDRGRKFAGQRELDKAIAEYTEAIRIDPNKADFHYFRGDSYRDNNDLDKAIADYTEAIRIDPNGAQHGPLLSRQGHRILSKRR